MSNDDLNVWLKASAENKITTKNTWQSTLIEHFTDVEKFKDEGNIDFQKASSTLEGCMKVYSTRVDDISEKTQKLLEIFSKDEEVKKKGTRKRSSYLEKNLSNIKLKEKDASDFYDPVFSFVSSKTTEYFLQDLLDQSSDGLFLYKSDGKRITMDDEKIEMEILNLPICDSLKEFENQMVERDIENDVSFEIGNFSESESKQEPVPIETCYYSETPFGYFKGWQGPSTWKMNVATITKDKEKNKSKRGRSKIDFTIPVNLDALNNKGDTNLSKEAILERRKHRNLLPEDFSYELRDLYKFIIKDGYFAEAQERSDANNELIIDENKDEIQDNALELSFQLENSLILDDNLQENTSIPAQSKESPILRYTSTAKKVDIKLLKQNILKTINDKKVSISEIYKEIPNFYSPNEASEISIHFCLVSLLHLANEEGFELINNGNDIIINTTKSLSL